MYYIFVHYTFLEYSGFFLSSSFFESHFREFLFHLLACLNGEASIMDDFITPQVHAVFPRRLINLKFPVCQEAFSPPVLKCRWTSQLFALSSLVPKVSYRRNNYCQIYIISVSQQPANSFGCYSYGGGVLLTSSGQRPGILLNLLQCTTQFGHNKELSGLKHQG